MAIKKVFIFDMDGVLCCSLHRYRTIREDSGVERIDLEHWRANEHRAYDDALGPLVNEYRAASRRDDTFVVIATARELRDPDMRWIRDHLGMPDYLISRPHGSGISGGTLKVRGLNKILNLKPFRGATLEVFEDNVSYLRTIVDSLADRFTIRGHYIPSKQGH